MNTNAKRIVDGFKILVILILKTRQITIQIDFGLKRHTNP